MWILHPDSDPTPNFTWHPRAMIDTSASGVVPIDKVFGAWGWWTFTGTLGDVAGEQFAQVTLPGGSTVRWHLVLDDPGSWLAKVVFVITTPAETVERTFVLGWTNWAFGTFAVGLYGASDGSARVYAHSTTQQPGLSNEFQFGAAGIAITAATGQTRDELDGTVEVQATEGASFFARPRFYHRDLLFWEADAQPDGKTPEDRSDSTLGCLREPMEAWLGNTYTVTTDYPESAYPPVPLFAAERQGGPFDTNSTVGEKVAAHSGSPLRGTVFLPLATSNVSHDAEVNARLGEVTVTLNGTAHAISGADLGFNQHLGQGTVLGASCTIYAGVRRVVTYSEPTQNNVVQADSYFVDILVFTANFDEQIDPIPGWILSRTFALTGAQASALLAGTAVTLPTTYTYPTSVGVSVTVQATG